MTKAEIVAEIANKTGIEKVAVQATVEAFMDTVKASMIAGENVYLRGFGSFTIKKRAKKNGKEYFEEHDHHYPGSLHSCFQTCQELHE